MSFSFNNIFKLILNETGLKASTVALELRRERSLMYKWLSGSSTPPVYYFPLIAQIVVNRTSQARQLVLISNLHKFINNAKLSPEIRKHLLRTDSVETLLVECMDLSIAPEMKNREEQTFTPGFRNQWTILLWALFAAVSGGLFWNLSNRLLGWEYFMGGSENNLRGLPAFFWGTITSAMIPLPLLFLHQGRGRKKRVFLLLFFTLTGGLFALLFFSSGIRDSVEAFHIGYAYQETILVIVFALCLSVPTYLSAVLVMNRSLGGFHILYFTFIPTGAALLAFLFTLIIKRPYPEILQLRGFVVGFALRITLFFLLFISFEKLYPESADQGP